MFKIKPIKYTKYKPEDIVGELTLIEKYSCVMPNGQKRTKWHCLCSCGKYTDVLESNLSNTTSCGHMKSILSSQRKTINLVGNKYAWLTVIGQAPDRISKSGKHVKRWHCVCDCGKEIDADGAELKKGTVLSCGCHRFDKRRNEFDLTSQVFNSILVIERLPSIRYAKNRSTYSKYKCICMECGSEFEVFRSALIRGQLTCGCINSKGEYDTAKILQEYGITPIKQFSFEDLLSPLGFPLFFDFAIKNNENELVLIEYQGVQHFEPQSDHFGDYQREVTDPLKREYCKRNNIRLYEISYDADLRKEIEKIVSEIYANSVPSSKEKV